MALVVVDADAAAAAIDILAIDATMAVAFIINANLCEYVFFAFSPSPFSLLISLSFAQNTILIFYAFCTKRTRSIYLFTLGLLCAVLVSLARFRFISHLHLIVGVRTHLAQST